MKLEMRTIKPVYFKIKHIIYLFKYATHNDVHYTKYKFIVPSLVCCMSLNCYFLCSTETVQSVKQLFSEDINIIR